VTAVSTPRRRLHPLSPILRGIKALWLVIAAISWQGFAQFGLQIGAAVVAGVGVATLIGSWVAWHFTGYWIAGRELHIHDGVLSRRQRTIPLERLQSVEVVQPLLARALGLAELRCEVVGAKTTEAPLAYLTLAQAKTLRRRLLELSRALDEAPTVEHTDAAVHTHQDDTDRAAIVDEPATPALIKVPAARLFISQLLTPQVFTLPFAVAATIGLFVWQPDVTFFGLAGVITATAGILLKPVRQAMSDYDFTMYDTDDGLRVRRGLTERRTTTLPISRVTAVMIVWPLLWRRAGWVNCRVANAGGSGQNPQERLSGDTLLPVGTADDARVVTSHALPGVDMLAASLQGVPRRARWFVPFGQPVLAAALTERAFITRRGRLTTKLVAVPYNRIQSVRLVQGPLQRRLGLASVHVDIAGVLGIPSRADHRELAEALHMAQQLRDKARAASPQPLGGNPHPSQSDTPSG
jgi:putative membrane protein